MASKIETNNTQGVLARLLSDQSGNVLAIMAASVLPLIGIVGGAVDIGRMYAVKTRLQAACDAGVIAGRRVMAGNEWIGNTAANNAADSMFALNFPTGLYGSKNLQKTYAEMLDSSNSPVDGVLGGTASADVPQTLMRVFGRFNETVTVTCNSEMKIPHTDLMFVLDTTGSMNCPINLSGCTNNGGVEHASAKIKDLRLATKCFYETLARENIDDVTKEQCFRTADPVGGLSSGTQLRFGFVPYAQTVNVVNLLPNNMVADQALYQSRTPNLENLWAWGTGTPGAITGWTGTWSPAAPVNDPYKIRGKYSGFTFVPATTPTITTLTGATLLRQVTGSSKTNCPKLNNLTNSSGGTDQLAGITEAGGTITTLNGATTNLTPVYPAAAQVTTHTQNQPFTVKGYSYIWTTNGTASNSCWLQVATHNTPYTKTQTGGTSSTPINWTAHQRVLNWTYQPAMLNIAGFKGGVDALGKPVYHASISLPLNEIDGPSLKLSGKTTPETIRIVGNRTINWQPCVEEVTTFRNLDGDPTNEWSPIPTIAQDMNIDHLPDTSNNTTRWRPMLPDAVFGHPAMTNEVGSSTIDTYLASDGNYYKYYSATCNESGVISKTTEARKMGAYRTSSGATSYKNYINGLSTGGGTFHDIGLIWGGRLMSPNGIFASENATTPSGAEISRHMVFMSDGDTSNWGSQYSAYGIARWDRRQTNNATDLGRDVASPLLNSINDTRQKALCNAIKAKKITLWVVFYGTPAASSFTRMKACASSENHFFVATDTKVLIDTFNRIASSISDLKLTS